MVEECVLRHQINPPPRGSSHLPGSEGDTACDRSGAKLGEGNGELYELHEFHNTVNTNRLRSDIINKYVGRMHILKS